MTCEDCEIALAADPRSAREDAAVREHLLACEACREALREFERMDAVLDAARPARPGDRAAFLRAVDARIDRAPRRVVRFLLPAAAAAAALAIGWLAYRGAGEDGVAVLPPPPSAPPKAEVRVATTTELCVRLRSSDAPTRSAALAELGRRPDVVSRSILVASLQDPRLAAEAVPIVGQARLREAIPALSRIAAEPELGEAAIAALASIGGRDAAGVLLRRMADGPHAEAACEALRRTGDVALAVLRDWARRARPSDEAALIEAVVALGAVDCLPWVASIAERSGPAQSKAISALGALGDARAVGTLARLSRETALHRVAVESLQDLREAGTRELARRVASGRREDRVLAILLLGELRDAESVRALVAALGDRSVRNDAARALGEIGDPSSAPALAACLGDPSARVAAIDALGRVADASTVPLLARLSRDPSLRRDALRILGRTGAPEALPHLVRALGSRETAAVAAEGLAALGEAAVPSLIRALAIGDSAPRAREALAAIAAVDLGDDPAAWQRWWRDRSSTPNLTARPSSGPEFVFSSGVGPST